MTQKVAHHLPRKRFGQNFLHDKNIIAKIIAAIAPQRTDHLIEIGPGQGALTTAILPLVGSLEVIELDRDLIPYLTAACELLGDLKIYQGDILKFDLAKLAVNQQPLRIFGNLPYNISTPLIFHLLDYIDIIQDMHFMLQKEVAERLVAAPGTEHYSRLSVMIQYHCETQLLFAVGPKSFTPAPKVDSAFIRLQPAKPAISATNLKTLQEVVRQAFSQRRKMLHNSLKDLVSAVQLESLGISPHVRPEQLAVADFVRISNIIDNEHH